jgi:hypothetical protein
MHGGATAIFAVMGLAWLEARPGARFYLPAFLPGLGVAIVLHSAYNHLLTSPRVATLTALFSVPALLYLVFERSEKAVGEWLGRGFDADTEMLELINSGRLSDSPVGQYLNTMKDKFRGPVVADLLCLPSPLHGARASRERHPDDARKRIRGPGGRAHEAKFAEIAYLEKSIGRTGLLAIQPMCHMSHKDLWQLYMLGA